MTEAHTKQIEMMIKSKTKTMKEMILLIKDNKNPTNSTKWTRRIARQREHKIIIDSGEISHFMSKDLNLPTGGASNKEVYLPNTPN